MAIICGDNSENTYVEWELPEIEVGIETGERVLKPFDTKDVHTNPFCSNSWRSLCIVHLLWGGALKGALQISLNFIFFLGINISTCKKNAFHITMLKFSLISTRFEIKHDSNEHLQLQVQQEERMILPSNIRVHMCMFANTVCSSSNYFLIHCWATFWWAKEPNLRDEDGGTLNSTNPCDLLLHLTYPR